MRLPGADYAYGVKSLGRVGNEAARVQSAHAEEVLTTRTAKNTVLEEFRKAGDAYNTWDEATQTANASAAMADYASEMSQQQVTLAETKQWSVKDIPEGVQIERERGGEPVEFVPSWQVAPQMYDLAERKASERAMARVTNPTIKEKLRVQLQNQRTQGNAQVMQSYFKDRMDSIRNTTTEALDKAILADNLDMVDTIIEGAVTTGAYSLEEGRKLRQDTFTRSQVAAADKLIGAAKSPSELEAMALEFSDNASGRWDMIPVGERVNLMQRAQQRALQIESNQIAQGNAARVRAGNEITNQILLSGVMPPVDQLQKLSGTLTPSQMKSVLAMGSAAPKSDQAALKTFDNTIGSHFSKAQPGADLEDLGATAQENLDALLAENRITLSDYNSRSAVIRGYVEGPFKSPDYKVAEDTLKSLIVTTNPFSGKISPSQNDAYNQSLTGLREYILANPKADPKRWVQENAPVYVTKAKDKINSKLVSMGVQTTANSDGTLNVDATKATLDRQLAQKLIAPAAYKQAINTLFGIKK